MSTSNGQVAEEWSDVLCWNPTPLEESFLDLFPTAAESTEHAFLEPSPLFESSFRFEDLMAPDECNNTASDSEPMAIVDSDYSVLSRSDFSDSKSLGNPPSPPHVPCKSNTIGMAVSSIHPQAVNDSTAEEPNDTKFKDYLHEFEGGPDLGPPRRKRRKFEPDRRKEVSQLRKVGACIRCKLTKSPVSSLPYFSYITEADGNSAKLIYHARPV